MSPSSSAPSPPEDRPSKIDESSPPDPLGRVLGVLSLLGGLSAGWALFLWYQLLRARAGAEPFCAFGADGCGALWDGPFASAVHRLTEVPVAGWGTVWGILATLLPLVALDFGPGHRRRGAMISATVWVAVAGLVGVVGLAVVSYREGGFCSSCAVTYGLTLAFVVVALARLWKPWRDSLGAGMGWATAATAVAFLLVLYPGIKTPRNLSAELAHTLSSSPPPPATGQADEATLTEFLASLPPAGQQAVADGLDTWRGSPYFPMPEPREIHGAVGAPVRIVHFTDYLCSHCADLFATDRQLRAIAPGSYSVEARQYPLDQSCNPRLGGTGPMGPVRCLAAKVRICLSGDADAESYDASLYGNQRFLDEAAVWAAGEAAFDGDRSDLESCVASAETAETLNQDITYAGLFNPPGTPLVIINGRQGSPYGGFLYAMMLAAGDGQHAAFDVLPEPRSHDGHEGHDH